jgi:type IV pilus assembly protein PilA
MLKRINKMNEEGGFTLIELLVVIIIIGILSAIAIPTFLNQREKAWKKELNSDLRNSATIMEQYFDDAGTYAVATFDPDGDGTATAYTPGSTAPYTFKTSEGIASLNAESLSATGYCLEATHEKGFTDNVYHLSSSVGRPEVGACP